MQRVAAEYVAALLPSVGTATVVALSGQLGAGKTTFAQGVAVALGVTETVQSPTFVIEKIYSLEHQKWQNLVHIDAYRLHDMKELQALGWAQLVADPSNLVMIEWPEHVPGAIPVDARHVSIAIGEGEARTIHYGN